MNSPILIAECGNNHEGRLDVALELLERAKDSGADLVKFQAGTAEGFCRTTYEDEIKLYRKYELGREGYNRLLERGRLLGIPVFFSVWSQEFDDYRRLPWFKIAGRQCRQDYIDENATDQTFISIPHFANPHELNIPKGIILHCVLEYPAKSPILLLMDELAQVFGRPCGYSDHTIGNRAAIAAAEQGACAIEKHFTLDHDFGPLRDHKLSATPEEFKQMVEAIRELKK